MARVRLKGIHPSKARLADGTIASYYYAWKGGPRLRGEPGSPEFVQSYIDSHATLRSSSIAGTLASLISGYKSSANFTGTAPKTRKDYSRHLDAIRDKFGTMPIAALNSPKVRNTFLTWRDGIAEHHPRQADYAASVLARVLSWALDRGLIERNAMAKAGRVYKADRRDKIWTADDEARFLAIAPPHMRLPILMGLWTGQRQGDILRLPWSAYDGTSIRLRQGKTGARVCVPVGEPLQAEIAATPRVGPIMVVTSRGTPWTSDGFRSSWAAVCEAAGISGLSFHDLRGTAITRLALAGATESEIAGVSGHALKTVHEILDAHYLSRDPALAESAIRKLEIRTKIPK